jgi:hypothetical protein
MSDPDKTDDVLEASGRERYPIILGPDPSR